MNWRAKSAGHGDVDAMVTLGYMSMNAPVGERNFKTDLFAGYCWLVRAALMDSAQAQEKLSLMYSGGEHDDRGNVLGVDLIQADYWFRLAARSPFHDNSQIRGAIEPKMTTAQMDQAKKMADGWHPLTFEQMKATTIAFPGGGKNCPAMS